MHEWIYENYWFIFLVLNVAMFGLFILTRLGQAKQTNSLLDSSLRNEKRIEDIARHLDRIATALEARGK